MKTNEIKSYACRVLNQIFFEMFIRSSFYLFEMQPVSWLPIGRRFSWFAISESKRFVDFKPKAGYMNFGTSLLLKFSNEFQVTFRYLLE